MTTATPRRTRAAARLQDLPEVREVHAPAWFRRLPVGLSTGGILVVLLLISAVLRTRTLGGQFWVDEAMAVGLASQPLSHLLSAVDASGAAPLFYVLLHVWMSLAGNSETATHAFTLLIALITIPLGMWAGWSIGGRRAGIYAAILFAFSSYLTRYAQDTEPFALLLALALLSTAGLLRGFVARRRSGLWLFGVGLTLMLYTQTSALLFWFGAAVALAVLWRGAEPGARRGIARDAGLCYGAAFVLYLPWLPVTISQIAHDTAPWHFLPLLGATVPSQLLGSERVDVSLLVAIVIGILPLATSQLRRTPIGRSAWALVLIAASGLLLARIAGFVAPVWAWRYFAVLVAPLLLLGALACARAKVVGVAAIVLCVAFLANPSSFAPSNKSDMQDISAEMAPYLHPGDVVLAGEPEETALSWYYLPSGLRFASLLGPVSRPAYMQWSGAMSALQHNDVQTSANRLIATLRPGQQLLYVRPLTEGAKYWKDPWSVLVRRRAAQWGQILTSDIGNGTLKRIATAPQNYRGSCCVAYSAMLYRKAS